MSGSFWGGLGRKVAKNWKVNLQTDASFNRNPFILNNIKEIQKNYSLSLEPEIEYYLENKFSFNFNIEVARNFNKIADNNWNAFWALDPSLTLKYAPIKKWKIKSDITYNYKQKSTPFNTDFKRVQWNAFTSFDLTKKRNLQATFTVKDILNQNNGYSRYFSGNIISESNNLAIRRYWLVGLIWKFNKSKIEKKDDSDDDDEFF
jgi:hypothetical protein